MLDQIVDSVKVQVLRSLAQPGTSLDVGCGDKRFTKYLPNALGVDRNDSFEGVVNKPDYVMDARSLDFPDNMFDNVALLDTLEHIPECDLVIKESWRVLKPDGVLLIIDPDDNALLLTRLLAFRMRDAFRGNPGHIHRFCKRNLVELTSPLFKLEKIVPRGIFTGYSFRKVAL